MTSLEIVDFLKQQMEAAGLLKDRDAIRHDNLKRSIERLTKEGAMEFPPMEEIPTATKTMKAYVLDKNQTILVIARVWPKFLAALIERWRQVEAALNAQRGIPVSPPDYPAALRALADKEEALAKAKAANAALRDTVDQAEQKIVLIGTHLKEVKRIAENAENRLAEIRHIDEDALLTVDETAVLFSRTLNEMFDILRFKLRWFRRIRGGLGYVSYKSVREAGWVTHKTDFVYNQTTGELVYLNGHPKKWTQPFITPKGIEALHIILTEYPDGNLPSRLH